MFKISEDWFIVVTVFLYLIKTSCCTLEMKNGNIYNDYVCELQHTTSGGCS